MLDVNSMWVCDNKEMYKIFDEYRGGWVFVVFWRNQRRFCGDFYLILNQADVVVAYQVRVEGEYLWESGYTSFILRFDFE